MEVKDYFDKNKDFTNKSLDDLISSAQNTICSYKENIEKMSSYNNKDNTGINIDDSSVDVLINKSNDEKTIDRDDSYIYSQMNVTDKIESNYLIASDGTFSYSECEIKGDINEDGNIIIDNSSSSFTKTVLSKERYSIREYDGYTTKEEGIFYEVCITFPFLYSVNYIDIESYCKFFQTVEYIKFSRTDNTFDKEYIDCDISELKTTTINFKSIMCKKIFIGITQSHYELITSNFESFYSYTCSISYIRAGLRLYSPLSFYSSNSIPVTVNGSMSLYCDEISCDGISNEYYISFNNKDFFPIVPYKKNKVYERMFFIGNIYNLRFNALKINAVYLNNQEIQEYTVKKKDDLIYALVIEDIAPGNIYSVDYVPADSSYYVSGKTSIITNSEIIKGNETSNYELLSRPCSDDVEIEILDNNKSKIYKGDKVSNSTDLNDSFNSSKFSYVVNDNRILFNKVLDDRYSMNVKYKVSSNGVYLKIISRNLTFDTESMTSISNIKIVNKGGIFVV